MRWILGFAPGGPTDIVVRLLGQYLSEKLGQQFVIDNRPGAGGNLATQAVVTAPPDGYTILAIAHANAINTTLYQKLPFDFIRDIAPVAGMVQMPNVLEVHPSVPVEDRRGVHRLRQGQCGQGQLRLGRQWHVGASGGRTVQGDDRRADAARAVSRLGTGADRPGVRPGAGDVRHRVVLDRAHPGRQAARARA